MPESPEKSAPSENAEFPKMTSEQMDALREQLESLTDISSSASEALSYLEHVDHEAASRDDSPHKYEYLRSLVAKVNEKLSKLPKSVEI